MSTKLVEPRIKYLLGVDGGGTGTRALVASADGRVLGRGEAGPSALGQGVGQAWMQVERAVGAAFKDAELMAPAWSQCALCAGLSGVHHDAYRDEFESLLPEFAHKVIVTDGYAMLVGAHVGQPGLLVASGTGSVGEALYPDGTHAVVGGWGFPVGDEGSGAWLGLAAVALAQAAIDGRVRAGTLAHSVWEHCGANRHDMARWVAIAHQFEYAQLAPRVFACEDSDPHARRLLERAVAELQAMVVALDPQGTLPIAVSGSVGERLRERLDPQVRQRCVDVAMGPVEGALLLLQKSLGAHHE